MKFRRRYEVVIEGVSGQAVAQRTVISDHRSEDEARQAAELERARLEVIHGGGAASWRILVVLGDEVLAEVVPEAEGEDLLRPAAAAAPPEPSGEPPRPAPAAAAPPGEEPPPVTDVEEAEPSPEGPVPDWVIQRFEDSIARRGEREEHGPADGEDAAA